MKENKIETIYRTPEEWKERWKVAEYHPNKEITGEYDKSLAVKITDENEAMKISFPWMHMLPLAVEVHNGK